MFTRDDFHGNGGEHSLMALRGIFLISILLVCNSTGAVDCQARCAIGLAEQSVTAAREQGVLWSTATAALLQAQQALEVGDCAAALTLATRAREHAELGLEQRHYPAVKWSIKEKL